MMGLLERERRKKKVLTSVGRRLHTFLSVFSFFLLQDKRMNKKRSENGTLFTLSKKKNSKKNARSFFPFVLILFFFVSKKRRTTSVIIVKK